MFVRVALIAATAAVVVVAQGGLQMSSLAPCASLCVNNMLAVASNELGCPPGDLRCYCNNQDFGYGIRDCSSEACAPTDAAMAIAYGVQLCANAAGGTVESAVQSVLAAATSGEATASPTTATTTTTLTSVPSVTEVPSTTVVSSESPLVAVVSGSDTVFETTTGSTTLLSTSVTTRTGTVTASSAQATETGDSAAAGAAGVGPVMGLAGLAALLLV